MFQLMNKDKLIATFDISVIMNTDFTTCLTVYDKLPIGCNEDNFTDWVSNRYASKHRSHLAGYLNSMNADNMRGFIKLTHSISINDTYWIKEDYEDLTWAQVSPYTNEFDEVIQHLSFDGIGLQGVQLSSTSPEFGTNGAYEKCWVREEDGIYLYKRGSEGFKNSGLEPYSEGLASQVFVKMNAGIPYYIVNYRKKPASKCKLFTNENIGFASYHTLRPNDTNVVAMLKFYESIGCDEEFKRMLVCDSITFNTDRHKGNFGCLYDTTSQKILGMAPCFDFNLALFPLEPNEAFTYVDSFISKYKPTIGNDFVGIARSVLTSSIRSDLINLKGFEYEYEGDDKFSKERVKWLTKISNEQIDHILGKHDVYVYTSPEIEPKTNLDKYRAKYDLSLEEFEKDVPRLMNVLGVKHMSELEVAIATLL